MPEPITSQNTRRPTLFHPLVHLEDGDGVTIGRVDIESYVWAVKAEVAFGTGDLDTAAADFDRAIGLGDHPAIRFNRGPVHEAAGRFAQAAADFEAVLAAGEDEDAHAHYDSCLRAGV